MLHFKNYFLPAGTRHDEKRPAMNKKETEKSFIPLSSTIRKDDLSCSDTSSVTMSAACRDSIIRQRAEISPPNSQCSTNDSSRKKKLIPAVSKLCMETMNRQISQATRDIAKKSGQNYQ